MMMLCAVTENKQSSGTASTLQHDSLYHPDEVTTNLKGHQMRQRILRYAEDATDFKDNKPLPLLY